MKFNLRPFFSYYGGKWRAAKHYPSPLFDTIIEPFAGAAGYATRHHDRNIILCDANPVIAGIWRYLIAVRPEEILAMRDLEPGESCSDLRIPQEAQWLVGMALNPGGSAPKTKRGKAWSGADYNGQHKMNTWSAPFRERVAGQLQYIRHWRIIEGHYIYIQNREATWFVDPPYNNSAGAHYTCGSSNINYNDLASWCRSRNGQTIVCEQVGADWLPFEFLAHTKSMPTKNHASWKSAEAIWYNVATEQNA